MKQLLCGTFLLVSSIVGGQDLTIKPVGDCIIISDTTTKTKDTKGLHAISGIEYIPTTQQWHVASDLGNYFIFDSIGHPSELIARSQSAKPRKTQFRFEAIRYDTVSKTYYFAVENDTITYVVSYESFPPTSLTPSFTCRRFPRTITAASKPSP